METGIVYSEKFLEHDLGPGHPERPERLESIVESLEENSLLEKTQMVEPRRAGVEDIELAHEPSYVKKIKKLSKSGKMLDLDTPINRNTFDLALLAAGGTIRLGRKITEGKLDNGFALVRPPGHHASRRRGGGFCYFNNLAIAASKLLEEDKVERVLIFDFDAHHGNGTQDIFYSKSDALYLSFHQSGRTLYPGTGFPEEVGDGNGEGYTVNVPLPPGSSDGNYVAALREFLVPLSEQFDPDLIMVSAGLDPHKQDPLTQLQLSTKGFRWIAGTAIEQAEKLCNDKITFVLEGGYATDAAAKSALKVAESLVAGGMPNLPEGEAVSIFEEVRSSLNPYWEV